MSKKSGPPNPHALFVPNPIHHFNLKYDGRDIPITTDYPFGKKVSAQYVGDMLEHIERVEEEFNKPLVHAARFFR